MDKRREEEEVVYPYSQITEIMYCRILKEEKFFSIPIKFTPIIPKLELRSNSFHFGSVEAR